MRLMLLFFFSSPLAVSKTVDIRCNVVPQCQAEWETAAERMPPQIKLACKGQVVHAKMATQREHQWQKISFDF
jgi:hypothetical protein